ncbi:MAG: hypothetical protein ACLU37_10160 [Collinsella sp.]
MFDPDDRRFHYPFITAPTAGRALPSSGRCPMTGRPPR